MKREIIITADDGLQLKCTLFECQQAKGLIQIIHGAKEHKERYYEFAKYLVSIGYHVLIPDNRGHGASVNDKYPLGYMDDYQIMINDIVKISTWYKLQYPELSLTFFGHSYGSILARIFLQDNDTMIDRLILTGTANYHYLARLGTSIERFVAVFHHDDNLTKIFTNVQTIHDNDWINSDPAILEIIKNDPLMNYDYFDSSLLTIMNADLELNNIENFHCRNPRLKILSMTGELDPVTGGKWGLEKSLNILRKFGYSNVKQIVYPKLKHEIFNTIGKEMVWEDIRKFLIEE